MARITKNTNPNVRTSLCPTFSHVAHHWLTMWKELERSRAQLLQLLEKHRAVTVRNNNSNIVIGLL